MGIRFLCPNGHRLNVKAFQAGRRGICPHCGTGVDIPLQSTRPTSKERSAQGGAWPASQAIASGDAPPPLPDSASNGGEIAEVPPPLPPSAASLIPPVGDPVSFVTDVLPPGEPQPDAPDPLADGPEVVWYLRPPSGGQYGPATQQVMRSWLREGRVTADSLVWREGWRDWEDAGDVFPESAFSQTRLPDAVPGLDGVLGGPFGGLPGSRSAVLASGRSGLNQALVILALIALGAAVLGAVYLWARFS